MDAKIETVRWYWQRVVDMRSKVRDLCEVVDVVCEWDIAEDERVRVEIAQLDGLLADGFTHFQAVRKPG